jgi:hypothetical protein
LYYDLSGRKAGNPNRKADVDKRTPEELLDLIETKGGKIRKALSGLSKQSAV